MRQLLLNENTISILSTPEGWVSHCRNWLRCRPVPYSITWQTTYLSSYEFMPMSKAQSGLSTHCTAGHLSQDKGVRITQHFWHYSH